MHYYFWFLQIRSHMLILSQLLLNNLLLFFVVLMPQPNQKGNFRAHFIVHVLSINSASERECNDARPSC